jgi:hypothetical protein
MNAAWVWLLWSEHGGRHRALLASPAAPVSRAWAGVAAARDRDDVTLTRS